MTTKKYETVLLEKQDGITWLIMNRPDKRNAMSPQLHLGMDDALAELAVDPQTQVLVLTGAGEAFCAGQDIKLYFRANDDAPVARAKARYASNQWRWHSLAPALEFPAADHRDDQWLLLRRGLHASLCLRFRAG